MRRLALKEFVDGFFEGSPDKLAAFLRRGELEPATEELVVERRMDTALL
jgi:hypothetical protein